VKELFQYFLKGWDHRPIAVIDHALRIHRLEDGSFHFYIHPAYQSGETLDFVVTADEFKVYESRI
jgi:hypothetical protein